MATYNTAFGSLPSTKELYGQTPGQQQQQQPAQQPTQQQGQTQQPQTFSSMQQQGQARPAPMDAAGLQGTMMAQLEKMFSQPSAYSSPAFQQQRAAQMANLEAQFGASRQSLEEEMARRGLSASSIGAGRYGDLSGQQSRAIADLESALAMNAAQMDQQGLATALQAGNQMLDFQLRERLGMGELDIARNRLGFDRESFYATLGAEESRFARSLDEQKALRLQNLGISEAQLRNEAYRLMQTDRSLDMQQAMNQAEIGFRAQQLMQQDRSLNMQEAQNLAQNQLERDKIAESSAARMMNYNISMSQLNLEAQRIENQNRQFGLQFEADSLFRQAEINLRARQIQEEGERENRRIDIAEAAQKATEEIERDRLKFDERRLGEQSDQWERSFNRGVYESDRGFEQGVSDRTYQREQDRNNLLIALAPLLGSLTPEQIRQLLGSNSLFGDLFGGAGGGGTGGSTGGGSVGGGSVGGGSGGGGDYYNNP